MLLPSPLKLIAEESFYSVDGSGAERSGALQPCDGRWPQWEGSVEI